MRNSIKDRQPTIPIKKNQTQQIVFEDDTQNRVSQFETLRLPQFTQQSTNDLLFRIQANNLFIEEVNFDINYYTTNKKQTKIVRSF